MIAKKASPHLWRNEDHSGLIKLNLWDCNKEATFFVLRIVFTEHRCAYQLSAQRGDKGEVSEDVLGFEMSFVFGQIIAWE